MVMKQNNIKKTDSDGGEPVKTPSEIVLLLSSKS